MHAQCSWSRCTLHSRTSSHSTSCWSLQQSNTCSFEQSHTSSQAASGRAASAAPAACTACGGLPENQQPQTVPRSLWSPHDHGHVLQCGLEQTEHIQVDCTTTLRMWVTSMHPRAQMWMTCRMWVTTRRRWGLPATPLTHCAYAVPLILLRLQTSPAQTAWWWWCCCCWMNHSC